MLYVVVGLGWEFSQHFLWFKHAALQALKRHTRRVKHVTFFLFFFCLRVWDVRRKTAAGAASVQIRDQSLSFCGSFQPDRNVKLQLRSTQRSSHECHGVGPAQKGGMSLPPGVSSALESAKCPLTSLSNTPSMAFQTYEVSSLSYMLMWPLCQPQETLTTP